MVARYLKKYGHKVLDNGYEVVPITPGTKFPNFDTWRSLPRITHKRLSRWQANGHAKDGIGIRAKYTPMLDIDSQWEPFLDHMVELAEGVLGFAPRRIGAAPKVGLIYRTEEPFKKVQSKAFTDPNGNKCQVEFLGDGQQWVAYAIHPETRKPYRWPDKNFNVRTTPADDLSTVTADQALELVNAAEQWMIDEGWSRWKSKSKSTALTTRVTRDPDDIGGTVPLGLPISEVSGWVERLNNDESVEYEDNFNLNPETPNYRNVIFAIWHETDGSDEGKEIALAWSEKSSKHDEEAGRFEKLWGSSDHEDRDDAVTFRYIIKCVLVQEEGEKREIRDNFLDELQACTDGDDLKKTVKKISGSNFDAADTERLAGALKTAFARVNNVTLPIGKARQMVRHVPTPEETPAWLKPWTYLTHAGAFYNRETGAMIEQKAFDAAFSRYVGEDTTPSVTANRTFKIPVFHMKMYLPGEDETYTDIRGLEWINTYTDTAPPIPDRPSKRDRRNIKIVEDHFRHLFDDEREIEILISFLAYIVKTGKRVNWMIIMQGAEGIGKTFIANMMSAVLGGEPHVFKIDPALLSNSQFTDWMEGHQFTFIDELKVHNHKFDVMDRMKSPISDDAVPIRTLYTPQYNAVNTTSYMAATNHKDSLPISDGDTRCFVMYSKWQDSKKALEFKKDNPSYFENLFTAVEQSPGAIRGWLMDYELHSEFHPKDRAPFSRAKAEMIDLGKSDAELELEGILEDDEVIHISKELIVSGSLISALSDATRTEELRGRQVSSLLSKFGYTSLQGQFRIEKGSTEKSRVWVKTPSDFRDGQRSIRRFLATRSVALDKI